MENETQTPVASAGHESIKPDLYPTITIQHIQNPKRLYAIPLVGGLAKIIMLIPVAIVLFVYGIIYLVVSLINSFYVLITSRYWDRAYTYSLGIMRYTAKISFYFAGLTDKYPGFSLQIEDNYAVEMPKPENPSRFFAIPIIGGVVRIFLLIPYIIYDQVLKNGATVGMVASSLPVLGKGRYPESTYEFTRDSTRVNLALTAYMSGLSDKYPSFWISMNHQKIKIMLIVIGALLTFADSFDSVNSDQYRERYNDNLNRDTYMEQQYTPDSIDSPAYIDPTTI